MNSAERVIVVQPIWKKADVISRGAAAMRLNHKTAAKVGKRKTRRIRKERFGSEHLRVKTGLQPQFFYRCLDFRAGRKISSVRDVWINSVGVGDVVGRRRFGGKHRIRENKYQPHTRKKHGLQHSRPELDGQA